jgi:hypothetical protein
MHPRTPPGHDRSRFGEAKVTITGRPPPIGLENPVELDASDPEYPTRP